MGARLTLWRLRIQAWMLIAAIRSMGPFFQRLVRLDNALKRRGPQVHVDIEDAGGPNEESVPAKLIVGFANPQLQSYGQAFPTEIRNGSTPIEQSIGFTTSAATVFERGFVKRQDLRIHISRLSASETWKLGRGVLQEVAHGLSDRFPDINSELELRLDLPHRAFDDLVEKIGTLRDRPSGSDVWLSVGLDSAPFPPPEMPMMIGGRVQSQPFRREFDVTRLHFELGFVNGFREGGPPRYARALIWTTTESRR